MGAKRKTRQNNIFDDSENVVSMNRFKRQHVSLIPKNVNQEKFILELLDESKSIVFGVGPAGSGKTYISVLTAIKMLKERTIDRIVVTRPAVSADEDLGFLPGKLEEKLSPWIRPIVDVLREYFSAQELETMMKEGIIECSPLSYMRGRNFKNSFIIADEAQLTTPRQMKMLLTRLSEGSKMAITGDFNQADRSQDNGLLDFIERLGETATRHISVVQFTHKDIERHDAVREVLKIYKDF